MPFPRFDRRLHLIFSLALLLVNTCFVSAQEESAVGSVMQLLKSGRLPASRLGSVVKLVCDRGNAGDLAYIYAQCAAGEYEAELLETALQGLKTAAVTRDVKPAGNLAGLTALLSQSEHGAVQTLAVELAGLWRVSDLSADLQKLAVSKESSSALRKSALTALARIGGDENFRAISALAEQGNDISARFLAIAAMVNFDENKAAAAAAQALAAARGADDPAPVLHAFLNLQGGPEKLATELQQVEISHDVAKQALRTMYSVGRTDAPLIEVFGKGTLDAPAPTEAEIQKLIAAAATGNAAAGERVFHRADLNCQKCHAINGVGGQVGPDLGNLGSGSPMEYIVKSILLPELAVKEEYQVTTLLTDEGKIYVGIIKDENDDRILLKEGSGEMRTIAADSVEDSKTGGTLMPRGLVNFLTEEELLNLARFISELGKPGEYAPQTEPYFRRWRLLAPMPEELVEKTPSAESVEKLLAQENVWQAVYGDVSGELHLPDLAAITRQQVFLLYTEFEVSVGGEIGLKLDSVDGISLWLDGKPLNVEELSSLQVEEGRHAIVLRVDAAKSSAANLGLKLLHPQGAAAQAEVVAGI